MQYGGAPTNFFRRKIRIIRLSGLQNSPQFAVGKKHQHIAVTSYRVVSGQNVAEACSWSKPGQNIRAEAIWPTVSPPVSVVSYEPISPECRLQAQKGVCLH